MNSGCYGYDISKILVSIKAWYSNLSEVEIKREDINLHIEDPICLKFNFIS